MNLNHHLWRLIGRKMAREATWEELAELRFHAQHDPQLRSFLAILEEPWKPAKTPDDQQLEQAWQRHSQRLLKTPSHPSPH